MLSSCFPQYYVIHRCLYCAAAVSLFFPVSFSLGFSVAMILQNCNVELTKVHYYDSNESGKNVQIATIFRNDLYRSPYKNTIIKRNIFGHKWVLKINESNENLKRSRAKLIIYVLMFICIFVAVVFGILLTIDSTYFRIIETRNNITKESPATNDKEKIKLTNNETKNGTSINTRNYHNFCSHCKRNEEVCLNVVENEKPKCIGAIDKKDPTGCGGLCKINKEYCRILDANDLLYQCRTLANTLNCTNNWFSCGNRCIPTKMRCDGIFDCSDQSDENNCECNLDTHFHCGNKTSCLDLNKRCNGKIDCWDHSDEVGCSLGCDRSQVLCRNGQCIDKHHFCDGVYQCNDKSDEPKGCEWQK